MRVVIAGGEIFDGTGAPPSRADVLIEDSRVLDVGTGLDGDLAIDVGGRTVLPGLFDCHVHVMIDHVDQLRHLDTPFAYRYYVAARNLSRLLDIGITTARDAGGAELGVKQAVDDGLIRGPRLRIALTLLSQTGGHADGWTLSGADVFLLQPAPGVPERLVDGPEEMRRRVRELVRAGADQIKLCASGGVLSPRDDPHHAHFGHDELAMAVREAEAAGRYVMAHAQAAEGIKRAVRAGVRSIEHGIFLDDEAIGLMLEHGTFLVPTLMAPLTVREAVEQGTALPDAMRDKLELVLSAHADSFRRAAEAGVRIAMGTDAVGVPAGRNLEELDLMVRHGLSPTDAWRAATSTAAELLGMDRELGTIAPGRRADLVVLDGDPMHTVGLGERVAGVWKDGLPVAGTLAVGT